MASVAPEPSTRGNAHRGPRNNRRRNRGPPRNTAGQGNIEPDGNSANDIPPIPGGVHLQLIPSSVHPPNPPPQSSVAATSGSMYRGSARGGRGERGGRRRDLGGRAGDNENQDEPGAGARLSRGRGTRIAAGRQFGGQLTRSGGVPQEARRAVQADAPEFIPGQQYVSRPMNSHSHPARRDSMASSRRRNSIAKSNAPDLPSRIHEDISNGAYECAICTNDLHRKSKVWSCKTCWTTFHLQCVRVWAKNSLATAEQRRAQGRDLDSPLQWRCPGCNLPKEDMPSMYYCWCEKEMEPRSEGGLPPHSCGQTCGKSRVVPKSCPHPCDLICHAGPCPPCSHMGPTQSCFCGKHQTTRKCIETSYDLGAWSCAEICGDMMPCGEHTCPRPCHEGFCGSCEEIVEARCYCGKAQSSMMCSAKDEELESEETLVKEDGEKVVGTWTGVFDCRQTCDQLFDCGKHRCEQRCHPQDAAPTQCPRSPDLISLCPCGKTLLEELSDKPRTSCEDPIPNCDKVCLRLLSCGHQCEQYCHAGDCAPCMKTVPIKCGCERNTFSTICHQGTEEVPQCTRICKTNMNCGRHDCGERCCSGERPAIERQSRKGKIKMITLGAAPQPDDIEPEHICTRVCGRPLKCGNHICSDLCHKGPCRSCREATFEDLYCQCGKTSLEAPVPCGTKPPPCNFDCERPKACGHPQVAHKCHRDDQSCPKCPYLMEKECMCGKKSIKNQPCWHSEVSCGAVCGKKLKCGSHYCQKPCHRPGLCEDATTHCQQPCGKPKKTCGHPCEEACHAPYPCKEAHVCPFKLLITCDCQHLKAEIKCNASKSSEGNSKKTLKCDDECARLARNQKLAQALNIDPATHQDDHIPYQQEVLNQYRADPDWAIPHESSLRLFAADKEQKRLNFKPMKSHQRAFVHGLAEDFGFDSESMDPEPYRHVAVFKTPKFVAAPMKTLAQCLRIQNVRLADANVKAAETHKQVSVARSTPFNGYYLSGARFGLTEDELRAAIISVLPPVLQDPLLLLQIHFLPHDEIAVRASHLRMRNTDLETHLRSVKITLATTLIQSNHLIAALQLCAFDPHSSSPTILRRESDSAAVARAAGGGGWSQVAAKGAGTLKFVPVVEAVGKKPVYTVLGSRVAEARRKKKEDEELERRVRDEMGMVGREGESVVEDWEVEAEREG